jgi:hypothetical protein
MQRCSQDWVLFLKVLFACEDLKRVFAILASFFSWKGWKAAVDCRCMEGGEGALNTLAFLDEVWRNKEIE